MPHLLLKNAKRTPHKEEPDMPAGAKYDEILGYWELGNAPLVKTDTHVAVHGTKKNDIETGEDQKGE